MLNSTVATRGMAVAPHSLAAQSALSIMRDGGNALEAMIAAAATIAVVYPHMNSLGGDGFWLIVPPEGEAIAIDACGAAALQLSGYEGVARIPTRGPQAALTVAGTVSGWDQAFILSREFAGTLDPCRLLQDAIHYAEVGAPVTASQHLATAAKRAELLDIAGFAETFLNPLTGQAPEIGSLMRQPRLATTLRRLAAEGFDSFYRGPLAQDIAEDLRDVGSPLTLADLTRHQAQRVTPLKLTHSQGEVYNLPPPTQGVVSQMLLGIFDQLQPERFAAGSADHVHGLVEATKLAFAVRDRHVTDPVEMTIEAQTLLDPLALAESAKRVDMDHAGAWGEGRGPGDTVWMGVIDSTGLSVSFIQSIYHEFGSGIVLPRTGLNWQNRGASFSLDGEHLLALRPGKKPFHTLNPAAARLKDGRVMVYGCMGGDGQPQTQAAVFTRYVHYGQGLQQAVSAPRWLLGRTWGETSDSLKLEERFDPAVIEALRGRGHQVELLPAFSETVGHAGAVVRHADGYLEGAFDPRANGAAAGY